MDSRLRSLCSLSYILSSTLICTLFCSCTAEIDSLGPSLSTTSASEQEEERSDLSCESAQRHISECLGVDETPRGACDSEAAEALLSMSCEELMRADEEQKIDGTSWLDKLHCRIGVLHFCPVPLCEAEPAPGLSESCIQALDASDCAQCEYYACLEESAQCGEDGYLLDFVSKYCTRFTQVTYPRLTDAGRQWMDAVRSCLIIRMDEGYYEGESCESIEERGIADHIPCYVDHGICDLPLGDWLKVMATIPPYELPLIQALSVARECAIDFFN